VSGTSAAHQAVAQNDLAMLVTHAAKERTEIDFKDLLNSAGFKMTRSRNQTKVDE